MVVAEVCSSMKYPKRCQYKHAKQKKYHVRNWAEYNEGLRRRGDLTVWFDEEAIANWKADKTGKPGGQRVYSDMAIETGLVVRMVYKLAYRQTEGFLHSIASLLGLGIEIPDYSTLCRRSRLLRKKLRIPKAASTQPIHLMIDSTGLRIHVVCWFSVKMTARLDVNATPGVRMSPLAPGIVPECSGASRVKRAARAGFAALDSPCALWYSLVVGERERSGAPGIRVFMRAPCYYAAHAAPLVPAPVSGPAPTRSLGPCQP